MSLTTITYSGGPTAVLDYAGPVIGFVLQCPGDPTVSVSGDTASLPLVEQISGAFDRIDIAVLCAGAARIPQIDAPLHSR